MLPKNSLRQKRMERLKVYSGEAPKEMVGNVLTTWRDHVEKNGGGFGEQRVGEEEMRR